MVSTMSRIGLLAAPAISENQYPSQQAQVKKEGATSTMQINLN